jgi:hypothetical protein
MQVLRGITGSLSTMGLFVLAYYHGRGLLSKRDLIIFAAPASFRCQVVDHARFIGVLAALFRLSRLDL